MGTSSSPAAVNPPSSGWQTGQNPPTDDSTQAVTTPEDIASVSPNIVDTSVEGVPQILWEPITSPIIEDTSEQDMSTVLVGLPEETSESDTTTSLITVSDDILASSMAPVSDSSLSLDDKVQAFIKELQSIKSNDEMKIQEKETAIAELESRRKELEKEVRQIQSDERKIDATIAALSGKDTCKPTRK